MNHTESGEETGDRPMSSVAHRGIITFRTLTRRQHILTDKHYSTGAVTGCAHIEAPT